MNPVVTGFAPDSLAAIDEWGWPGNVRELENRIKRAVIMADGRLIGPGDLDLGGVRDADRAARNLRTAREQSDRRMICKAFVNRSAARHKRADALRSAEAV